MKVDLLDVIRRVMASRDTKVIRVAAPFDELGWLMNMRLGTSKEELRELGDRLLKIVPMRTLLLLRDGQMVYYAIFRDPSVTNTAYIIGPWVSRRDLGDGFPVWELDDMVKFLSALVSMYYPDDTLEVDMTTFELGEAFTKGPTMPDDDKDETELLEQKYDIESRMLEAVKLGDTDTAKQELLNLRNILNSSYTVCFTYKKSRLLVMNTLLRKTIENSKVHPYYIEQVFEKYVQRIETMNINEEWSLANNMLEEYCQYVQQYSVKNYSPLVQRVLNHIATNLGHDLTLTTLAKMCHVSSSYMSKRFKKEVGMNLIDYITKQRMDGAAKRLCSTSNSISTIAAEFGFMDTNYFSKTFKKVMGCTPTQFRKDNMKSPK